MKVELCESDLKALADIVVNKLQSDIVKQATWTAIYDQFKETGVLYTDKYFTGLMAQFAVLDGIEATVKHVVEEKTLDQIHKIISFEIEKKLGDIDLSKLLETETGTRLQKLVAKFQQDLGEIYE